MAIHTTRGLDQEWVKLIAEAKKLGLSIDDIKKFLHYSSSRRAN
jgi:DNA-binding transcriptional MerR regulator